MRQCLVKKIQRSSRHMKLIPFWIRRAANSFGNVNIHDKQKGLLGASSGNVGWTSLPFFGCSLWTPLFFWWNPGCFAPGYSRHQPFSPVYNFFRLTPKIFNNPFQNGFSFYGKFKKNTSEAYKTFITWKGNQ